MATVTCKKKCFFYIDDEQQTTYTESEAGLTPGLKYTPSASSHMPDYDRSVYTEYEIKYNGTDYTTGSFTCPDEDFKVYYYFYGYSSTSAKWKLGVCPEYSYITGTKSRDLSFGAAGYVARFQISFAEEGEATFYTSGALDTYGYLSTDSTLDTDIGGPSSSESEDDDSGDGNNFKITCYVYPDLIYYLWVRPYSITATGTTTVYIKAPGTSVKLWNWSSSNGDATATQTQAARTAIRTQGAISDFSYLVWNDLVSKVKETLTAVGSSWNTAYLSFSDTKMSSSDKTLTAARFNSVRYNIDRIGTSADTELELVEPGDKVLGSYFTTLTTALNAGITAYT